MPHSSGGGSHGGGSHGGSHSSSRSSGPSGIHRGPYAGSTRYVYYRNKKPVFIYSDSDSATPYSLKISLYYIVFVTVLLLLISSVVCCANIHSPTRLTPDPEARVIIKDEANIFTDIEELYAALNRFFETTGIAPTVLTVKNEVWSNKFLSLEHFAYNKYLEFFPSEKYWLIVYSPGSETEDGFDDWHWEGMQGDNTDNILSTVETDLFNNTLQKALLQSEKYTVENAIAFAFDTLTPVAMKKYIQKSAIPGLCYIAFIWLIVFLKNFHPIKYKYYKKAEKCPDNFVYQEKCKYCGGVYIVGFNKTCPHCGAPV